MQISHPKSQSMTSSVLVWLHFFFFLSMAYYTQNIKIFSHFGNFHFIQCNVFWIQKHIGYKAQPLFRACTFWVLLCVEVFLQRRALPSVWHRFPPSPAVPPHCIHMLRYFPAHHFLQFFYNAIILPNWYSHPQLRHIDQPKPIEHPLNVSHSPDIAQSFRAVYHFSHLFNIP